MRTRLSIVLLFAMTVAAVGHPVVVFAQRPAPSGSNDLADLTIEELLNIPVQTASRTIELQREAPARVQIVTAAQIHRRGYRSLLDVLNDLADFKVDLRGNWDFPAELTVQGVRGATRVIVLLDGVRVSAPTNEPLPIVANYPVHDARQIEIVYGPASALYGADAFSAVINIISKSADDSPGLSVRSSVGAFGLHDSSGSYATHVGSGGRLVVSGQYQHDDQPDLSRYYPGDFNGMLAQRAGVFPTIFGPMTPTDPFSPGYHIPLWARSVHAAYRAGGLSLMAFENRSHLPTTAGLYTPDNVIYDAGSFNENALLTTAGSYVRDLRGVTMTSTVSFSRHELNPRSGYRDLYSNMERSYKYAYGAVLKGEQQVAWKPLTALTLTAGGTVERFSAIPQTADLNAPVASRNEPGTILGTNIVDEFFKLHYVNAGAFAEGRYAIGPRVVVTAGARMDVNTRYQTTFNPRVGLVARGSHGRTWKLLYGTAFLAPSPYQAYQHYGSFLSEDGGRTFHSPYWHLPNPDLRPQHKKTVETSLQQQLGGTMSVSASVFYSRFRDLIQPTDPAGGSEGTYHGWPVEYIDRPVNEGHESLYGGTFAFDSVHTFGLRRRIATNASLSLADGGISPTHDGTHYPIGGMAPVQWRLGSDLDWDKWTAAPRLAIVGTQRLTALTETEPAARRTLPGYWTFDMTGRRTLTDRVDAFVRIDNVFDRRYRTINERAYINAEEFIGVPQNPRRVAVGVDWRIW